MDQPDLRDGHPRIREAGFSLPLVLWSLLLATILVMAFLAASRTATRVASNTARNAEAAALAEAGVSIAILDLVEASRRQDAGHRIPIDGTAVTCRMPAEARVTIVVEDEAGKIDINRADDVLLRYALVGIGHSLSEASRLADRIIDYRDADELRRLSGAEREEYQRAGRASGPADAPFLAIEELQQVLDMPARTVDRLLPLVTVDGDSPGIDLSVAPLDLVETLSRGITGSTDLMIAADAAVARAALPLPLVYRIRSPGIVFHIRAVAVLPDGSESGAAAIVVLVRKRTRAYEIRRWLASDPIRSQSRRDREIPKDIGGC